LAKCVKESIEFLRPRLKTGDLGDGLKIDALEPIKIDDIVINRGEGFYVNLNNLKAFGAMNFKIEKLRVNVVDFKIDVLVEIPKIEAYGKYKLQMLLGILNLKGEGNVKANLGMKVER
jgi:Haemolymph juvenile hormone binding protein (JHBP)